MVEGFVPPPPEKANEVHPGSDNAGKTALSQEAFKPQEVQRVGDTQTDKPKDPAQVYQKVFAELNTAKQDMLGVNDIIAKGGGPYAQGDGLKAYQQELDQAQQHYTNARLAADTFLYVCDKNGNPMMDSQGHPLPSKENLALQEQMVTMQKDMQQHANDQSPEGRQRMAQEMQAVHQISDLLRSSGYARANNAFALMFHSADLKGQDRANFAKTGVALLAMASKFDPAMMGPPPDPNFMKHYDSAMNAVLGVKPGDQPAPAPNPGDQPAPPKPGDQPHQPGDQPHQPGEQPPQGAQVVADGNQYYINYGGLHVPTWTAKNPDGSASKPFAIGNQSRADGLLKPVTDAQGKVMGMDGQPLMDANGMRRIGNNGLPVPAEFDATDPMIMQAQLEHAIGNKPLDDSTRAAYNKVIESSDELDRVSMAKAIETNKQIMQQNQDAGTWELNYDKLHAQLGAEFQQLAADRQGLTQAQLGALQKMWTSVKAPQDIDTWLNNPANKADKDALTADAQKWTAIKDTYSKYLSTEEQIKAQDADLAKNPTMMDKVRKFRAAEAMNQELGRLFASSIDTRAGYMAHLLDESNVKKYMADTDKNSADAKALENDPNVKEAKRVIVDLAKENPQLAAKLSQTAKALGVDLASIQTPGEQPAAPKPGEQPAAPKPGEQPATPKPGEQPAAPKPGEQPAAPKPGDANAKPGEQPAPAKPGDTTQVAQLSTEQANAPQVELQAYRQFLQGSDNATKPMPQADFDKLSPVWDKAVEANAAIKPEQLKAYEQQAQSTYANQMALALALQKTGKKSFDQLVPDDLKQVTKDDLQKAMTDKASQWMTVSQNYNNALNALKPEEQAKFRDAEKKFTDTMTAAQQSAIATRDAALKAAGGDQTKQKAAQDAFDASMKAAYGPAYQAKLDAEKAITPALKTAIEAQTTFLNDPAGVFAKQFTENMQLIDTYRHVDEARIQYAQALALEGGDANKAKAKQLLDQAMKNPDAAKLLETTSDGQKLMQSLGLQTPDQSKQQSDQDKIFPEMKLARDATDAAKTNWQQADAKFKAAEQSIDAEILQRGKSLDPSVKDEATALTKINQAVDSMKMQLGMALDDFKNGRRNLPGNDGPQKDADTKLIRSVMNGDPNAKPPVPAMTEVDMIQALMGQKGPQLQAAMQRVLTASEKDTLNNMAVLAQKAQNVSLIRMQHALMASDYGFKHNDQAAKNEAKDIVAGIAKVDPVTFQSSPEVIGALKQAEDGKQMNVADGSAATLAFSEAAKDTIQKTQTGLADWLVPGASLAANSTALALTNNKHYASDIPVVGGLFGGSREANDKLVNQMVMAQLNNAQEAQQLRDQTVKDGHTQLRGLAGDVTGVGTSFLTGYGVSKGLQYVAGDLPWYIKAPVIGLSALGAGGLANNAVAGKDLLSGSGFIRNTVATGTTYGFIKGLEHLPGNQSLSEATIAKLTERGVVTPGTTNLTGAELGKLASAEVAKETGASKLVQLAQAAPSRLNPLNYTPFRLAAPAEGQSAWNLLNRFQFAGWGGDTTANLFANGAMNLAEYNTRQFASKALTTFGLGYGAGALNKGADILSGEHLDGKKYDTLGSYFSDMNTAGLQTGLTTSLMIPILGKTLVPQSWQTGIGKGVTNLFTRLPGLDAAGASTAATGLGSAALMWARPTMDAQARWGEATIYDNIYQQAKAKTDELKKAAEQKLQQQQQGQPAPSTDSSKK